MSGSLDDEERADLVNLRLHLSYSKKPARPLAPSLEVRFKPTLEFTDKLSSSAKTALPGAWRS